MKMQNVGFIFIFAILIIIVPGMSTFASAQSMSIPAIPYHPDISLPIPTPTFPENGTFQINNQPTFEWSQNKNITGVSYHFEWTVNNPTFNSNISPIYNAASPRTSITLDYPLPNGAIYWRVFTEKGNNLSDMSLPSSISTIFMVSEKNPSDDFLKIISNPVVAGAVGTAVGGLISFIPNYWIENKKHSRLRKNVKNFVKEELQAYFDFIQDIRKGGIENTNGDIEINNPEIQTRVEQMMPNRRKFNPTNYPNLTAETKSQVFDMNTLTILDETYRLIRDLQESGAALDVSFGGMYVFDGESIRQLENSITKAIINLK